MTSSSPSVEAKVVGLTSMVRCLVAATALLTIVRPASAVAPAPITPGSGPAMPAGDSRARPLPGWLDETISVKGHTACDGSTDDAAGLAAAQAAAGSTKTIVVTCRVRIATPVGVVSAPVIFWGEGSLDLQPGGSVTLTGPIDAGLKRVFWENGGSLTLHSPVDRLFPQWWGAVSDDHGDDAPAIQAAIDHSLGPNDIPRSIGFPPGIYRISKSLTIRWHWLTFEGRGQEKSVLRADPGVTLFTVPGGAGMQGRHGLTFRGLQFSGQPTPAEYFATAPIPIPPQPTMVFGASFFDCKFQNLRGVFDAATKKMELTGQYFERVEFENAPLHMRSKGVGNAFTFLNCRWSSMTQGVPATWIEEVDHRSSATQVHFVASRWEGNDHSAVKLTATRNVQFDNCYWEQNNRRGFPVPDVDTDRFSTQIRFALPYAITSAPDRTWLGSSAHSVSYGLIIEGGILTNARTPIEFDRYPGYVYLGQRDAALGYSAELGAPPLFAGGAQIGSAGAIIRAHYSSTARWDAPRIADGAIASTQVTVVGARVGDTAVVGTDAVALPPGALLVGAVTADDTVTVTLLNKTGRPLDLPRSVFRADVWHH